MSETLKKEINSKPKLKLVKIYADWCRPCVALNQEIKKLKEELLEKKKEDKILFEEVDFDKVSASKILEQYGFNVQSLPTLLLYHGKELVGQEFGYKSLEELKEFVNYKQTVW